MKSAVCLVVQGQAPDTVLAISRRNNRTKFGFPGGKVDPGEGNVQALIREVSEEAGVQVLAVDLEPIYSGVCPGKGPEDTYWVTTYLYTGPSSAFEAMAAEEGLHLEWLPSQDLASNEDSPFAAYNKAVFDAIAKRKS